MNVEETDIRRGRLQPLGCISVRVAANSDKRASFWTLRAPWDGTSSSYADDGAGPLQAALGASLLHV